MKNIINIIGSFFSQKKNIFEQTGDEIICHVCKRPVSKYIRVGSGQLMHSKCWADFFSCTVSELKDEHYQQVNNDK